MSDRRSKLDNRKRNRLPECTFWDLP